MEKLLRGLKKNNSTKKKTIGKICKTIGGAILALSLAVSNLAGVYPTKKAYAAGTRKALQMVTNATAANIEGAQASKVYFGNYYQNSSSSKDPIEWRVLQNSGSRLFLFADKNLDCKAYNDSNTSVTWDSCTLHDWLNGGSGGNFYQEAFSGKERQAIATTSVIAQANPYYPATPFGGNTNDKVFLLSIQELAETAYGFTNVGRNITSNTTYATSQGAHDYSGNGIWWLRSPGSVDYSAVFVRYDGFVGLHGNYVDDQNDEGDAVRPAFNLDLSSVILTSAAAGGKSSGNPGADALREVAAYSGNEWKLTLLDDGTFGNNANGHAGFSASRVDSGAVAAGNNITVSYSGANTGSNEYVSAILVSATNENNPLYYGRIANNSASSTGADITIPSGLAAGDYKIKVFAEQYNGDEMTDYASAFGTIDLVVEAAPASPAPTPSTPSDGPVDYFADLKSAFDYAITLGGNRTVTWNRDSVLNYDIMKLLAENPSITLAFSYTYEDMDYLVTIPGRLAKPDPEIPIYGPLYLYGTYGGTAKKN